MAFIQKRGEEQVCINGMWYPRWVSAIGRKSKLVYTPEQAQEYYAGNDEKCVPVDASTLKPPIQEVHEEVTQHKLMYRDSEGNLIRVNDDGTLTMLFDKNDKLIIQHQEVKQEKKRKTKKQVT